MVEKYPQIVGDEEQVARVILSPSYVYNGRVSPTAFRWDVLPSGDAEDYISVLRGDESNLEVQTRHFKARTEGDVRFGYAMLEVLSIRNIGKDDANGMHTTADVQSFPSKSHPNHAGIVVEIDHERVTALTPVTSEIMMIQKELSLLCSKIVKF